MTLNKIFFIYLSGFLLAVHYASVAYVNSSLLTQFVQNKTLGILYIVGSILSLISLVLAPSFLRKIGNKKTLLIFILLEIFAVLGMGSFEAALLIIFLFLLHQAAESMLYFSLDIELEEQTKIESATGSKRGIFLTTQNIAWVLSPFAISFLISGNNLENAYFLSGLALMPLFLIALLFFKKIKNAEARNTHFLSALSALYKEKDKAKIVGAQFVLNFFFSWMIIYLPLLLNEIGFGWDKIGLLLTIMLLPYLFFELPAGILADRKFGEKEALILGFLIMVFSTAVIPFLQTPVFWIWAVILFATRIGASLVEISSESYFFKHVKEIDTGAISLFRMARPFSFILAPLLSIPILYFTGYSGSFLFLALATASGLFFLPKKDTR
ncbi:MAG: MFS transporter [Patescibacteria group bacterium]